MVELELDALTWCQERIQRQLADKVLVSMYRDGTGGSFELGVALHIDTDSLSVPLTYFTSELSDEAYQAYSWLIDDYVRFLVEQGIPARRLMADFE
jgi:hypothetical protein